MRVLAQKYLWRGAQEVLGCLRAGGGVRSR